MWRQLTFKHFLCLLVAFNLLLVSRHSSEASQIADCCCDTETIDLHNHNFLNELLTSIRKRTFFRIFQVDIYRECKLWNDNALCYKPTCSVAQCCEEEVPQPWKEELLEKIDTNIANPFDAWVNEDEDQWVSMDSSDSAVYVDLERNPDGYTGYKGEEAGRVWRAMYEAKKVTFNETNNNANGQRSTADMETEERVLYRLISGFHTLTSAMVFANYPTNEEATEFGPNVDLYERFLHPQQEYINNLYFDFVFLLRAVNKASNIIRDYDYNTGNEKDDTLTKQLIDNFINTDFIQQQCSVSNSFDESALFRNDKLWLMDNCRRVFRNISEILDCVGCDKCKLHAKLEFLGLGTALKILFTKDVLTTDFLQRNELIALIVTLSKYSDAVRFINEMEAVIAAKNEKPLPSDRVSEADTPNTSSKTNIDENESVPNKANLNDFIEFFKDVNRLTNIDEWKRMFDIFVNVQDNNDFLDYPRNVIAGLFFSFLLTIFILFHQLYAYCPDTHKHESLEQSKGAQNSSSSDLSDESNMSLHAGEQSVKRKRKRKKV